MSFSSLRPGKQAWGLTGWTRYMQKREWVLLLAQEVVIYENWLLQLISAGKIKES